MKTPIEFFRDHLAEFLTAQFKKHEQSVEIVWDNSHSALLVFDAPEFDYQNHRASVCIEIIEVFPIEGALQLAIYNGSTIDPRSEDCIEEIRFGRDRSFGDALCKIENILNRQIGE